MNENLSCGTYLDVQKAFDCVNHDILLHKLYHYGIRGSVFDWLKSYLPNRSQLVCINECRSAKSHLRFGVPQGSSLGPLFFLIHINDLPNVITDNIVRLYADDANNFRSHFDLKELKIWLSET